PADALQRRELAGLAAELSHDRLDARAADSAEAGVPAAPLAATALPARRAARRAGPERDDARRVPAPAPSDARRDRWVGRRLPHVLRGHRPHLPSRAGGLGAVVRAPGRRPARVRRRDRQALRDPAHALARPRDAALPAQAPRAAGRVPLALYFFGTNVYETW